KKSSKLLFMSSTINSIKATGHSSGTFAVQSSALEPKLSQETSQKKRHAYTLPIKGLIISTPVSSLPLLKQSSQKTERSYKKKPYVAFDEKGKRYGTENSSDKNDKLATVSKLNRKLIDNTPATSVNFEGINKLGFSSPADASGAVGLNHYVQIVNLAFAVFDKQGVMLAGPFDTNSLWQGFGGDCEEHNNGDAITLYDQQADRFLLSQFAINGAQSVCFAVSTSPDPLGTYYLYELKTQRHPDYYKLGVWPDSQNNAYFMGTNSGQPNSYDVYAIDRLSLISGLPARPAQFFQGFANFLLPADNDGSLVPPTRSDGGSGGLFYTIIDAGESYFSDPPPLEDSIDLYEFKVNWDVPSQSSFDLIKTFQPPEIADFNWTVCGLFARSCLLQAGTTTKIDSGSWWPMHRFVYRNFGSYESLLGSWTIDILADGDQAAPRWFEMRKSGAGQWYMQQQGSYAPDSTHRWMSSIAINGQGDIGMVYNVLDDANNINPGIRFTSRRKNEPPGQMRNEATLIEATGVQTSTFRWGDYSSMNVDPADDCRFWMSAQYIQTTGNNSWNTRIGAFNFPDCVAVVASKPAQSVCTANDLATFDLNLTGNYTATTNLSLLGCPTSASCDFSINPVVNPGNSSQMLISNLSNNVAENNYTMTVIATDSLNASLVSTTPLSLTVVDGVPEVAQLTSPINNALRVSTLSRTFQWQVIARSTTYLFELSTDSAFNTIVESHITQASSYVSTVLLLPETNYYWRITTQNVCGNGVVSLVKTFISAPLPGQCETGISANILVDYDFENGTQGWNSTAIVGSNNWLLSNINPDTGMQHWRIPNVPRQSDTVLTSPTLTLPAGNNTLTLHFNNAQDIEANGEVGCWDGGLLEVSTDGGESFVAIANNKLLTDPYNGPLQSNSLLAGQDAWCGNPQAYLESIINLDDYANQEILLRFRLVTDAAAGFDGWDIDDIKIQSCANSLGVIFKNGFEDSATMD
ncbi:MAG: immune inhibitor A, partial [Proteobacteria bacterium]|nr:immune inhibitor A [Pseudomonadota bacterium]